MLEIHRGEHHGVPLLFSAVKVLMPSKLEQMEGILSVQAVIGWCQDPDCRKRFVFSANEYPGGLGPSHRHREARTISSLIARMKEAKESDWVWGSNTQFPYQKMKVKA
jgi:hypothetical protein